MAGLGDILAGAAQGLGEGIMARADAAREDALLNLKRQWQKEDQETQRGFEVADRELAYSRGLDEERRGYEREDSQIDRRATALESVFGSGEEGDDAPDPERALYVARRFEELGYPKHVAAGLVGNLIQESGAGLDTGAVGDGGNSVGMGQWNGPRGRALVEFAEERGVEPTDLDVQIDFLDFEMKNGESEAYKAIMETETAEEAARVASERFWRPGTPMVENRQRNASEVFRLLADPDTPASVRDAVLGPRGLGIEAQRDRKPVNLSASLSADLRRRFVDRMDEPDMETVDTVEAEILRQMQADPNLSETAAKQKVLAAMKYEEGTKTTGDEWWNPRETRQVPDGESRFTGEFIYGDEEAAPARAEAPPAGGSRGGLGGAQAAPAADPKQAEIVAQAQAAIAAGADRAAVIARLEEMGIDPKGL